jgi:NTP pyrophosphatase (non-canonical NTP hydrolase)
MNINTTMSECHSIARSKGFWDDVDIHNLLEPKEVSQLLAKLALIHSEVSEATEAARTGDTPNFEEEIADIVIRCFDLAGAINLDLELVIQAKIAKNKNRPYRHGKLA